MLRIPSSVVLGSRAAGASRPTPLSGPPLRALATRMWSRSRHATLPRPASPVVIDVAKPQDRFGRPPVVRAKT